MIDRSQLHIVRTWDRGPFGAVHEIRTPGGITAGPTCLYQDLPSPDPAAVANLRALIAFRRQLSDTDRRELDSFTAWPLEVVETTGSAGSAVGYVTTAVPGRFLEESIEQSSGTAVTVRTVDWLIDPQRAGRAGARVVIPAQDTVTRMTLCARLSQALQFLHDRGVVVGDLGQVGVAFSMSPAQVMLIGLASARVEASPAAFEQPHAPGTMPPECRSGQSEQTVATDLFKAGLLFHDILAAGARPDRTLSGLAGRLDQAGIALIGAALGADGSARPTAQAWAAYFDGQVRALSRPPSIGSFEVNPARGVRGQAVDVSWTVTGHRSLVLETPSGETHRIEVGATDSVQLRLQQSGQFRLVAANQHGTAECDSEIVLVFDAPAVQFVDVPDLGAISRCVTGLDVDALRDTLIDDPSPMWIDSLLTLSGSQHFDSARELLDRAVPPPVDISGLFAAVDATMRRAERQARRQVRIEQSTEWIRARFGECTDWVRDRAVRRPRRRDVVAPVPTFKESALPQPVWGTPAPPRRTPDPTPPPQAPDTRPDQWDW